MTSILTPTTGVVGRNHPTTSKRAAKTVEVNTGTQRHRLLWVFYKAGRRGVTDDTARDRAALGVNSIRARRGELAKGEYVERVPARTGESAAGNDADLWRITSKGIATIRGLGRPTP